MDAAKANPTDLRDWCVQQSQDQLLALLVFAAAHSVNVVETKLSGDRKHAFAHGDQLGRALKVDMHDRLEPSRSGIEVAVNEAAGEQAALAIKTAAKKQSDNHR